jgi:hypothetical protein
MKRRDLLKAASATAGALAVSPLVARAEPVPSEDMRQTDVVVSAAEPPVAWLLCKPLAQGPAQR